MCEFCDKHGEGKKWYLRAENYSRDLQSDLQKRMTFDVKVFSADAKKLKELKKAPFFVRAIQEPRVSA